MTIFLLYLWLKLDTFVLVSALLALALLVIPGILWIASADTSTNSWRSEEEQARFRAAADKWRLLLRKTIWCSLGLFLVAIALPSQKEGAYLIAGYAGLKLAETPEMSKLTELVRLKVGNYLDDELKSAKADAEKAVASAVQK